MEFVNLPIPILHAIGIKLFSLQSPSISYKYAGFSNEVYILPDFVHKPLSGA